jgi:hypothetical protein
MSHILLVKCRYLPIFAAVHLTQRVIYLNKPNTKVALLVTLYNPITADVQKSNHKTFLPRIIQIYHLGIV